MGSMSASDAAPLPRLGEVFFDVRGNSRSMRLSWYADTGVAVLSIWQGGMCTGTFRLAIADLPRMVQTLQHGPGGPRPEWDAETPDSGPAAEPAPTLARMRAMPPLPREDLLAESEGPRTGVADYPARPPDDPRSASTQYLAPPGDYQADPPGSRVAPPDYLAGAPGDRTPAPSPDYLAGPPSDRTPPPDYLAGPPGDRGPSPDYLAGPPGRRAADSPDYLADPPQHRAPADYPADPPQHRAPASADYLASPPEHRAPADYPADPPQHRADPPGYPADRPDYLADPPGNYLTGPANYPQDPPGYRPEYLADLADPSALRPGGPGAWNPGPDRSPYPPDRRGPADHPQDPYQAGQADYRGESPTSHYQPGSSASGDGYAPGRSAADYPAHYASTVTDDDPLGPSPDSFPYARPPGTRRAASRHAAPDAPFD
jgi:hypothetical protein